MDEYCLHNYVNHHLIYREELKKDGEKKVLCSNWLCREPIWGSLHNCVECGNRPFHWDPSSNTHSGPFSKSHSLEFTEKLENDGNKQVVCSGCDEPVLMGPAYKCSVSKCSFFIHKSCSELFPQIKNHPLHPHHTLTLKCLGKKYCDHCRTPHASSFFYNCDSCDFQLDIKCANHLPINPNDCHQHEFFFILRKMQFNCDACGEEITNLAYRVCNICKIFVHTSCATIPRTVKIKLHNHFLNLIYSLREINKRDDMICRICGNKVKGEYAAYSCQKCSYNVHTKCLIRFRDEYGESLETGEIVGHATHLIKALNQVEDKGPHLVEFQHFSHQQHKLILCHDEIKDDKLCKGCMEFIISVPFYSCAQCNFFLHTRCAELPTKIMQHRVSHFDSLTLLPLAPTKSSVFSCLLCHREHRGFAYSLDKRWSKSYYDIQCGSIPESLNHEGHQHSLLLALDSKRKCNVCSEDKEKSIFVCTKCDFALGIRCANLPLVARHKYDTHLLKLTYSTAVKDSGEYYCLICEEERNPNHWFYYCEECDFPAHVECVLGNYLEIVIGGTYKSKYHRHPLTFVQKSKDSICDSCSHQFDDVALECSQCKLKVHPPRLFHPNCLRNRYDRYDNEDECNSPDDDDDDNDNDDERNSPDDDDDDDDDDDSAYE